MNYCVIYIEDLYLCLHLLIYILFTYENENEIVLILKYYDQINWKGTKLYILYE
jgi:hypothetical protein